MKASKLLYIYLILLISVCITGCKKWLDVKPENKFIEEQLFSNPQGFYDVLNGFYNKNGQNNAKRQDFIFTTHFLILPC